MNQNKQIRMTTYWIRSDSRKELKLLIFFCSYNLV